MTGNGEGGISLKERARLLAWIGGISLLVDAVTKLAARAASDSLVPPVPVLPGVSITWVLNESMIAAPLLAELQAEGATTRDMLVSVLAMTIAGMIALALVRARQVWWVRLSIAFLAIALLVPSSLLLDLWIPAGEVDLDTLMPFRALGSTLVVLFAMRASRSRSVFAGWALVLGGNAGNLSNMVYEPRGVIDFLLVPVISPYVFNVADVAIGAGASLAVLAAIVGAVRSRTGARRRAT